MRKTVSSTQYSVSSTQYSVHGTQYSVHGSFQFSVLSARRTFWRSTLRNILLGESQ
jgi:hypothetical protein